jgi:hypothetical protein
METLEQKFTDHYHAVVLVNLSDEISRDSYIFVRIKH